jgi:alkylation response protein AidB-like acyl-CoA dehydrogenase
MGHMTTEQILEAARDLGPMIEAAADEIDELRCLPDRVVEGLRAAGVFRVAFPEAWGGPEMTILDQVRMIETLAYHDASTAWVAMICSDSGHYAGRLPDAVARELYPSMDVLTSGLLFPVGRATRVPDGFRVSGRWQFGSGCRHADQIVGGCLVFDGDAPVLDEAGRPEMFVAWLPREQVEIHDTWFTTGLAGSGSHDYSVTDAFVPDTHRFDPFGLGGRPETLYRYHGFFFANLCGVALGCARRMVDDLKDLMRTKISMPAMVPLKDEYRAQLALADATARLGAATAYQDETLSTIWSSVSEGGAPTLEQRATLALMLVFAAQSALEVAEIVCEVVGAQAIYRTSPFERRRRDLATLSAHVVAQRKSAANVAPMFFGDVPGFAFV